MASYMLYIDFLFNSVLLYATRNFKRILECVFNYCNKYIKLIWVLLLFHETQFAVMT